MSGSPYVTVLDNQGLQGVIRADDLRGSDPVAIRLEDGREILVAPNLLVQRENGSYYLPYSLEGFSQSKAGEPTIHGNRVVIPVIEEEVVVGKRWVETGRVRARKVVHEEEQTIDEPLLKEDVEVQRVTLNQVLDEPATDRYEGDTLVIPVMEEMLVVEKRLVLREEIRITRHSRTVPAEETVKLHREEVVVERLEPGQKPGKPAGE